MIHEQNCPSGGKNNFSLLFCGDTFLQTHDGASPFSLILPHFGNSLVCVNLETSLKEGREKGKNISLSVKEESLDFIPENVQFVSIVNNHMADGENPNNFANALEKRGKIVIGPTNPSRTRATIDGMDVVFFSAYFRLPRLRLSYNGSVADKLEEMISTSDAERCVVNLHWGYEHTDVPAPFQRHLAHRLVDAGATIIIGHHPHVPQGWEIYCGAPIFYSLGNFNFWQFDTETTEKNKWGYMVRYDIRSGDAEPIPYQINENYQPVPVGEHENVEFTTRIDSLSRKMISMDSKTWFVKYYQKWRSYEYCVWKKQCSKTKSPAFLPKFIIWLILPMQIWYYAYTFSSRK